MKGARLLTMVVIAGAVAGAAAVVIGRQSAEVAADRELSGPVAPGLQEKLNGVRHLQVSNPKTQSDIRMVTGNHWVVEQMSNYPADTQKIRQFLYQLATSVRQEKKTASPELFGEINLTDGLGVRVQAFEQEGQPALFDLMFGLYDRTFHGTFVRGREDTQTWLASGQLEPKVEPLSWIDPLILDLNRSRVWSMRLVHEGKPEVSIRREKPAGDFTLDHIPKGRELSAHYDIYTVSTAMERMRLANVAKGAALPDPVKTRAYFRTMEGMEVEVDIAPGRIAGTHWAKVQARYFPQDALTDEAAVKLSKTPEEVKKEVDEINARTADWVYILDDGSYRLLTKTMEDVTQPLKAANTPAPKKP